MSAPLDKLPADPPRPVLPADPRSRRAVWNARLRLAARALLVLLTLALLTTPGRWDYLTGLWAFCNMIYLGVAGTWALFHPKALWRARDSALRWTIVLSLLGALVYYSVKYSVFLNLNAQSASPVSNADTAPLWLMLLGISFFFCLLALAAMGAAVGAFAGRHGEDIEHTARDGIHICLFLMTLSFLIIILARPVNGTNLFALIGLGFPLITRAYLRVMGRQDARWLQALRRSNHAVGRCLVWRWQVAPGALGGRWPRREWRNTIDLRGPALGAAVAGATLILSPRLIGPLQSQALTTLIRLRAAAMNTALQFPPTEADLSAVRGREHLLIARMDDATRFQASQTSEIAVQADIIARLLKMGATRVVLPLPVLHDNMYPRSQSQADGPAPTEDDKDRNRRDSRALADLLRKTPTVLLALPETANFIEPVEGRVIEAAALRGDSGQSRSRATFLPLVPAAWNGLPPVSALICAALNAPGQTWDASHPPLALKNVPGFVRAHTDAEGVLVNFTGRGPREDFARVTYADIRANTPVPRLTQANLPTAAPPVPGLPPEGQVVWEQTEKLARGRVVFLDSLAHPVETTPVGVLSQSEAQAYAAATLMSEEAFTRMPPAWFAALTLLLGAVVGHTSMRREPLDAVIRALAPLFTVLAGSLFGFVDGLWFDPIIPLLVIGATLAIATQMRFARERAEKRRASELFGRFVAPHMVREWLARSEGEPGLGGKRERLCVLFADVRNFTLFAEQHDATEVIDIINAYMTALTDALAAHGGILDKYTGDGLMAFFLPQQSPPEDAAQATRAACAMRDAALALSTQRQAENKPTLAIGLSLHYGEAVVGLVGNARQQINYTALGLTVVVAARLQTIARGGDLIVSEEVYALTRDAFTFEAGEPVQVKGLSQPVHPYRVLEQTAKDAK